MFIILKSKLVITVAREARVILLLTLKLKATHVTYNTLSITITIFAYYLEFISILIAIFSSQKKFYIKFFNLTGNQTYNPWGTTHACYPLRCCSLEGVKTFSSK